LRTAMNAGSSVPSARSTAKKRWCSRSAVTMT
jgi:hypothetical protein